MQHVLCAGGQIAYPASRDLRQILYDPPQGPFVVSWATSKKKHHVLHAGMSTAERQIWGSDFGPIILTEAHRDVLLMIEILLVWHRRKAILHGVYTAPQIAKTAQFEALEGSLARYRGQRAFNLLVALAVKTDHPPGEAEAMLDPTDADAAGLLAHIARASTYRVERGLDFWSGYFRSRIERHAHRHLGELVSRLLDECGCSPAADGTQEALAFVSAMDAERALAVKQALERRAALMTAEAFRLCRTQREAHHASA
jgi:hypothetical protein